MRHVELHLTGVCLETLQVDMNILLSVHPGSILHLRTVENKTVGKKLGLPETTPGFGKTRNGMFPHLYTGLYVALSAGKECVTRCRPCGAWKNVFPLEKNKDTTACSVV